MAGKRKQKSSNAGKEKFTKAAKGVASADVANIAVRYVLCAMFEKSKIKLEDMEEAENFFDWKCPYTGVDLKERIEKGTGFSVDHISGQNQVECGLNVKGNLVYVASEANSQKGGKSAEDFLRSNAKCLVGMSAEEREDRIKKIKEFQEKNGYQPELIKLILQPKIQELYKEIQSIVEGKVTEISNAIMEEENTIE